MSQERRHLTPDVAHQLTLSTEPYLSCDDCFRLMDVYVEKLLADPATTEMPEMRVHLAGCPACAEEAESLRDLLTQQGGSAG